MTDLKLEKASLSFSRRNRLGKKGEETSAQSLTVALLFEDLLEAREVAKVFRKIGVIPQIYQSLREYWEDVYQFKPALSVIDAKMMSEGKLLLKNHPLVQSGTKELSHPLKLSIYYKDDSAPLLHSAHEIDHLGLISGELSLRGQVKSVLRRFNQMKQMEEKVKRHHQEEVRLEGHVSSLLKQVEGLKEKDYYARLTHSIIERFDNLQHLASFDEVLERVMTPLREVESFAIYELARNGQKLISPEMGSHKGKTLPPIWLGSRSQGGIQNYAQTMAQQVGAEILGGELMALSISAEGKLPTKLLLLKVSEQEVLDSLDWDQLERYLSGLYSRFLLRDRLVSSEVQTEVSPWEMLSLLDRVQYDGKNIVIDPKADASEAGQFSENLGDEKYSLISLSFTNLLRFLQERKGQARFYWKEFYREFFRRFDFHCQAHYRLSTFGVGECVMLVDKSEADRIFSHLRVFVNRYPLWRYFEDVDIVLTQDLKPSVKMLPVSSLSVIHHLLAGLEENQSPQERVEEVSTGKKDSDRFKVSPEMEMILADQMAQAVHSHRPEENLEAEETLETRDEELKLSFQTLRRPQYREAPRA